MKRIALYHNLPAGGAMRHTYEQVRELARRGHEIHAFTHSTADLSFLPFTDFVAETHVYDLRWNPLSSVPVPGVSPYLHIWQNRANLNNLDRQSREIARAIDEQGFDLVFAKDCRFTIAPYILRYLITPSILYLHSVPSFRFYREKATSQSLSARIKSWPETRHEKMIHDVFRANVHCAGHVLTNSRFSRQQIFSGFGIEAAVVYPGVDLTRFYPRSSYGEPPFVLSAGTLNPRKGHELVIQSLALLLAAERPRLIVASPIVDVEKEQQLRRLAAECAVAIDIQYISDTEQMARLYSNALILVFAPTMEWLGLVALEAMACGTPVIGVAEGGLVETIQDGRTGFLVERDSARLAEAVERLLRDRPLRDRLGRQSREYIEGYWTWTRAVDDLEKEFNRATSGNNAARPTLPDTLII